VSAAGRAIGEMADAHGRIAAPVASAPANAPASGHIHRRLVASTGGSAISGDGNGLSAARTFSGVSGNSRKRTPVASKIALVMAAALGTEADSPLPSGSSSWRGTSRTSMSGTSGNLRIG
jgi:hypothetical protein